MLHKLPWRKSVTITVICPPAVTSNTETNNRINITKGKEGIPIPRTGMTSGISKMDIRNRDPTPGNIPKFMIPLIKHNKPVNTLNFLL